MDVGNIVVTLYMLSSNPQAVDINQTYTIQNNIEQDSTKDTLLNARLENIINTIKSMPATDVSDVSGSVADKDVQWKQFVSGRYIIQVFKPDSALVMMKIGGDNFLVYLRRNNAHGSMDVENYFAMEKYPNLSNDRYELIDKAAGTKKENLDVLTRAIKECENALKPYFKK